MLSYYLFYEFTVWRLEYGISPVLSCIKKPTAVEDRGHLHVRPLNISYTIHADDVETIRSRGAFIYKGNSESLQVW